MGVEPKNRPELARARRRDAPRGSEAACSEGDRMSPSGRRLPSGATESGPPQGGL